MKDKHLRIIDDSFISEFTGNHYKINITGYKIIVFSCDVFQPNLRLVTTAEQIIFNGSVCLDGIYATGCKNIYFDKGIVSSGNIILKSKGSRIFCDQGSITLKDNIIQSGTVVCANGIVEADEIIAEEGGVMASEIRCGRCKGCMLASNAIISSFISDNATAPIIKAGIIRAGSVASAGAILKNDGFGLKAVRGLRDMLFRTSMYNSVYADIRIYADRIVEGRDSHSAKDYIVE